MVSPGDNMVQTEPSEGEQEWLDEKCKNCTHTRLDHLDRAGCMGIDRESSDPEVGILNRCHCTNFEVKE